MWWEGCGGDWEGRAAEWGQRRGSGRWATRSRVAYNTSFLFPYQFLFLGVNIGGVYVCGLGWWW